MTKPHPFAIACALALLCGCGGFDELTLTPPAAVRHTVELVGYVYDGAVGNRLTEYLPSIEVGLTVDAGTVDAEGRYSLGDIGPWDDFTILLDADGYRAFRSHNAAVGLPPELEGSDAIAAVGTHQTKHFDAYLFPDDLAAPAVSFTIKTDLPEASPAGTMRLRPTSFSLLADEGDETPGGVPGQVWDNDEDLQAQTLTREFSAGTIAFKEAELVYGVSYQVDIYAVDGYQPFRGGYVAGVEGDKTFTLVEEVTEPITLVSSNAATCAPGAPNDTQAAVVTLAFNQPIELAESTYPGGADEALDDSLQISSPDANVNDIVNTLRADASATALERATSLTVTGSGVDLKWGPAAGLETKDTGDPIEWVRYGGLGQIRVQRAGKPASAVSLSSLLGASEILCDG